MVSDFLLDFAAVNYGFDKSTLHFISESTNQIYSFQKNGIWYILRFSRRPFEHIGQTKAEMDWLYYLANNKINVSLPLPANGGELVVSTADGGDAGDGNTYVISAFEVLRGKFWNKNDPNLWNGKIFYNWGKITGEIHRLTKGYNPAANRDTGGAPNVRSAFNGYETLFIDKLAGCPSVHKIAADLVGEILAFPKDADSYGLIHYDIHPWNFLIDGDGIGVFDFDDCLYGWFAMDIGIALYHGLWWGRKNDAGHDFSDELIERFICGYRSENSLNGYWASKIPVFMKYRQLCKLSWFYNPENIDADAGAGAGADAGAHQNERVRNIENGVLFSGFELNQSLFK